MSFKWIVAAACLGVSMGCFHEARAEQPTCFGKQDRTVAGDPAAIPLNGEQFATVAKELVAKQARLLIEGIDVTQDANPRAVLTKADAQGAPAAGCVEFRLDHGPALAKLWTTLYQRGGLLGVDSAPVVIVDASGVKALTPVTLMPFAVTSDIAAAIGIVAIVLCAALFIGLLIWGDVFRDDAPAWLLLARARAEEYENAVKQSPPAGNAVLSQLLVGGAYGTYDPALSPIFLRQAVQVRAWEPVDANMGDHEIAVGLLLQMAAGMRLPKSTFSLARVQLGVWFFFTVAAAIYIGVVYHGLPPISGSMIALLGITSATSAASMMVDNRSQHDAGGASRGLWRDITSGSDSRTHLHRYQAVVVNALLFGVAVTSVLHDLTLPTFDPTWLGLLGVSGATQTAMKAIGEASA